jgi:hypothetical protein
VSTNLADAAAAIDRAAIQSNNQGPIDDALLSTENSGNGSDVSSSSGSGGSVGPVPEKKRGRKKGGKNRPKLRAKVQQGKDSKTADPVNVGAVDPDPAAAAADPAQDYMKDALSGLIFMAVEHSKTAGYPSPGMGMMEDRQWCLAVSDALDTVLKKYLPASFNDYQAEFVLATLVIPYAIAVATKVLNDRRKNSRASGIDRERENSHARDTSAGVPPMDSNRPDAGRVELLPIRRESPQPNGSGRENAHG